MKVVDIKRAPTPNPSVVESLELMLAMAKAGELQGLLAIGFLEGGRIRWSAGAYYAPDALWALEQIKADMLRDE